MSVVERRDRWQRLADALAALNTYKRPELREAFDQGAQASLKDEWNARGFGKTEKTAYGRGWNAVRDDANTERFPVLVEIHAARIRATTTSDVAVKALDEIDALITEVHDTWNWHQVTFAEFDNWFSRLGVAVQNGRQG